MNGLLGCPACAANPPQRKLKHNDYLPEGITFAKSLGVRMYLEAVLTGSVSAATEVREAQEGRATMRVEVIGRNDRLESLINALNTANQNPPPDPAAPPVTPDEPRE